MTEEEIRRRIQLARELLDNPVFEDEDGTSYYKPGTFSKITELVKGCLQTTSYEQEIRLED